MCFSRYFFGRNGGVWLARARRFDWRDVPLFPFHLDLGDLIGAMKPIPVSSTVL